MAYPQWLYHREHAPDGRLIPTDADAPSGDGWVTTPAAFDPTYVAPPLLPEELVVRGGRPFVAYPAWRYHANGEAKLVETAEVDEQLDKTQWKESPADVAGTAAIPSETHAPPTVVVPLPRSHHKAKDKD